MRGLAMAVLGVGAFAACGGTAVIDPGTGGGSGSASGSGASATSASSSGTTSSGSGSGSSGSGAGSSSSSSGDGCAPNAGECSDSVECFGQPCVALTPCGYRVCEQRIDEADSCSTNFDECCDSTECLTGSCYRGPIGPFCGGIQPPGNNICIDDECKDAGDCPAPPPNLLAICTPPNTMGSPVRSCIVGSCRVDSDCNAEPGGVCGPVQTACCNGPVGLYCSYPSDGCLRPSDCAGNTHCDIDGERARCLPGPAICPA